MNFYSNGGGLPQTGIGFLDGNPALLVTVGIVVVLIGAGVMLCARRRTAK